ncbi:acyltransferase family protein [Bifidobacterium sp. ESL0790]|uniref:acyltransferase family protein n=1 Tax=Bifidobacterium sp. ESL0790 TaxID=2983233 RepID=UPI0023F9D8CA|nr:acyltransferase family protein [Bifidobacterium sp. ESL0790]WEV72737.1 acyltransferase family protein [Bifidobacterium sp. ESL0790]
MDYEDGKAEVSGARPEDTASAYSAPTPRQRVAWIDVAKAITMFLVVYGHINTNWLPGPGVSIGVIYLFHMPAFFLLSGIFFSADRPFLSLAKHRAYQLLEPYYFFAVIVFLKKALQILFSWLRHGTGAEASSSFKALLKAQVPVLFNTTDGLWFLWSLFTASLLLWCILKACHGRFLVPISLALLVADAAVRHVIVVPLPFFLNRVLSSTAYLALGYAFRSQLRRLSRAWGAGLFAGCGAVFAALAWAYFALTPGKPWWFTDLVTIPASLFGISMLLGFARIIPAWRPLRFVGGATLIYYGLNNPMVNICEQVFAALVKTPVTALPIFWQDMLGVALSLAAMLLIAVLVPLLRRYLWWGVGLRKPAKAGAKRVAAAS